MFNEQDLLRLKKSFSEFSVERMCRTTNSDLPALYKYLEYYGFLYTLKGLGVEYYCGYRRPTGRMSRWGRIATHYWRLSEAKGTVFVVHGLFDHVGLFQPAIRFLLEEGFSVVAFDLPGHGLSDGEPTVINSFDNYGDVLADTVHYFRPYMQGAPYALGQSTGAAVILNHCFRAELAQKRAPYKALVLLAPLVRPVRWKLISCLHAVLKPILRNVSRNFVSNSHDETFNHFLAEGDLLQSRKLSVRWISALHEWVNSFAEQPMLDIPTFIAQGTGDKVVDWQYNIPALQAKLEHATVFSIDDAMHHLVNESPDYRRPLVKATHDFLAKN